MTSSPVAAVLSLPVLLGLGLGLHLATATSVKAVLRAFETMAPGELAIAEYERRVLSTAEPGVAPVAAATAGIGASGWLALVTGFGPLWLGVPAALAAAVWLDLRCWGRVVVSAERVCFRLGQSLPLQQVPIERIADVGVDTTEVAGFTLRHGRRGEVSRLWLRLTDGSLLVLPPTEAARGEEAVEAVANHVRVRRAQWLSQGARQPPGRSAAGPAAAATLPRTATAPGQADDADLLLALQRLRQRSTHAVAGAAPTPESPASTSGSPRHRPPRDLP